MARKSTDQLQEMLRKNYLSSDVPADEVSSLTPEEAISNSESVDSNTAIIESSETTAVKANKSELYITTVRLPNEVKNAIDLYRIDIRPQRGVVSFSQLVSEALRAYIPEKYFE